MIVAALVYLAGFIIMMLAAAVRTPSTEVRPAALLALMWPVILPLILLMLLADAVGWTLDFDIVGKPFGYRKPTNPAAKGFAVTVFYFELRVFKGRTV